MQTIAIFQQKGSGTFKVSGINEFGDKQFRLKVYNIDDPLPELIDDTSPYLPDTLEADLVLDFLRHQDLSDDLSLLCRRLNIPVVASGKKTSAGGAICPPT